MRLSDRTVWKYIYKLHDYFQKSIFNCVPLLGHIHKIIRLCRSCIYHYMEYLAGQPFLKVPLIIKAYSDRQTTSYELVYHHTSSLEHVSQMVWENFSIKVFSINKYPSIASGQAERGNSPIIAPTRADIHSYLPQTQLTWSGIYAFCPPAAPHTAPRQRVPPRACKYVPLFSALIEWPIAGKVFPALNSLASGLTSPARGEKTLLGGNFLHISAIICKWKNRTA